MKQLSGLDAACLYMETATTYGHVTGLMIFERPGPDYEPYAAVYAKYASLVGQLEPLRRRAVEVPFGLDHPYRVVDPAFDLDFHVRELHLARPGLVDQLAEQVCRIVGRPMDRTRPLWEVYVIDGLQDGRWALLTKYHHATIDGASGQLMMKMVTDTEPDVPAPGASPPWEPEPMPSTAELLRLTLGHLVRNPFKAIRVQARIVRQLADAAGIHGLSSAAALAGAAIKRIAQLGKEIGPTSRCRPRRRRRRHGTKPSPAPPLRDAHRVAGKHQAAQAGHRRDDKRHRDGDLRRRAARIPAGPRCAAGPPAAGDGAGVDSHRRRGGPVDQPGVGHRRRVADRLRRSAATGRPLPQGDAGREARFELVPAAELVDLTQYSTPVLATAAVRLASRRGWPTGSPSRST